MGRRSIVELLDKSLAEFGMDVLGAFRPEPDELDALDFSSSKDSDFVGVMVANFGQKMWPSFTASSHYNDGQSDPLNRWSSEVLGQVAKQFDGDLRLPFERPFLPFQNWAKRTGKVETSPLGILIHPEYGLWFGLRGVLFVNVENQQVEKLIQPPQVPAKLCQECTEKPCLSACPVNAFGDEGLNVKSCFSHLERVEKSAASPNCLEVGCAARAACPVANEHQYSRDQLQFHMHAYYR